MDIDSPITDQTHLNLDDLRNQLFFVAGIANLAGQPVVVLVQKIPEQQSTNSMHMGLVGSHPWY